MQKMIKQNIAFLTLSVMSGLLFPSILLAYEAAPVSLTKPATFVSDKGAQLNGQANPGGMPDAVSWFEWGLSGNSAVYTTPNRAVPRRASGNVLTNTSAKIIGLAPGTQYFFRQIVESSRGKDVGQTTYFTTKPRQNETELVIVETNAPKMTNESQSTLRGYVSPHGNADTESWFEWGSTQRMEMQTPRRRSVKQAGPVEVRITQLTPGTLYFYRVVRQRGAVHGRADRRDAGRDGGALALTLIISFPIACARCVLPVPLGPYTNSGL